MTLTNAYQTGWYYDPLYGYPALVFSHDGVWYVRWVWHDSADVAAGRRPPLSTEDQRLGTEIYQRLIPLNAQVLAPDRLPEPSYGAGYWRGITLVVWSVLCIGVGPRWSDALVAGWGYRRDSITALLISLGLILGCACAWFLLDYGFWKLNLTHSVRAGIWAAAGFGPVGSVAVAAAGGQGAVSYLAGMLSTLVAFCVVYLLDRRLLRRGA